MPGSMDERVVSMEFDNKSFEKNVKTSMGTLDKLKKSLDFDDTSKSLEGLDDQFSKFSKNKLFSKMDDGTSALRKGLLSLGSTATSVFGKFGEAMQLVTIFRMAESAINSLQRSIRQFTIVPISQGFDKYTEKISSIKTISNATGLGAENVNNQLDRLNWFTDETSASFSEMVNNIGKFTSVGKGLDESITAMQGIAAWGYHSGANVAEQTRAMYNLSQALGTGAVKLMDWKSIENAGMATKEFKEQALAAAEAAGTLKRKGDKLYTKKGNKQVTAENFNSTLANGWFTSDVLMKTLETYGGFAKELKDYIDKHPGLMASDAMAEMDMERMEKRATMFGNNLDALAKKSGKNAEDLRKELDSIKEYASSDEATYEEYEKKLNKFAKSLGIDAEEVERINKIADPKTREKEIKKWAKTMNIDVKQATNILDTLADTEEKLGEKAFKSSQQSKTFKDSVDATLDAVSTQWMNSFQNIFGGLDDSIALWTDVTEILWELFAAGGDMRNNALNHWAEEFKGREDLWGEDGVMHNIMDTIIELKDLFATGFKDVFFKDFKQVLEPKDVDNIRNGLYTIDEIIYRKQGSYYGKKLKGITSSVKEFTASIKSFLLSENNIKNFRTIFQGFFSVIMLGGEVIGGFVKSIVDAIKKSGVVQDILNFMARVSTKVQNIIQRIQKSGFIQKLFTKIGNTLVWFYNLVKNWGTQISNFLEKSGLGKVISDFFNNILEFFIGGADDVDENGNKLESKFFRSFGWLHDVKAWLESINLETALNKVKTFIDNFSTIWSVFSDALSGKSYSREQMSKNGASGDLLSILTDVESFGLKLSGAATFIRNIFDKVVGWLESSGILPTLREWWDGISTFFGNIGLIWDKFVNGKDIDPSTLTDKQNNLLNGIENFINKVKSIWNKIKTFITNFSTIWTVFTDAIGGKSYSREQMSKNGASGDLLSILTSVEDFGHKLSGVFSFIKNIYDKVVGWLESSGILPTLRGWWDGISTFFGNIGLLWDTFVNGKAVDPSKLDEKQLNLISTIQQFITRVKSLWEKIKGWFNKAIAWVGETWGKIVSWLEESGVLPKIRSIWSTITKFFGNIGLLWDIFVNKQGEYNPDDLTEDQLSIVQKIENFINTIKEKFEWIKTKFKEIKDTVLGWLEGSGILPTLRNWWSEISNWFDSLFVPEGENGPLASVEKFVTGLWEKVTGLFGGKKPNESSSSTPESSAPPTSKSYGPSQKNSSAPKTVEQNKNQNIFSSMFSNIVDAFTNEEGALDLTKGFSTSIAKVFEMIGSIDWTSISTNVFGVVVDVINGLDDAAGKLHFDNIIAILQKIAGAFTGLLVAKSITDITSTVKTVVKKGKDKGLLEQFTDTIHAIGTALMQIGIAVALIAASMWVLSQIDPDRFGPALGVIIGIGAFFILLLVLCAVLTKSGITGDKKVVNQLATSLTAMGAAFVNIGIAVALIAASIVILTVLFATADPAHIWGAIALVSGIMIMMVGMIALIGVLTKKVGTVRISAGIAAFGGIAILIATIAVCILLLQKVDFVDGIKALGLLGIAIAGIVFALKFLSGLKISPKVVAPLILLAVVIGILAAAFILLKDADPVTIGVIAGSFSGVLLAMVGAVKLMENLGPGAIKGAAIFAAAIVIIVAGLALSAVIAAAAAVSATNAIVAVMSNLAAASNSAKLIDSEAIENALALIDEILLALNSVGSVNTKPALDVAQGAWDVFERLKLASFAAELVKVDQFDKIFGKDGKSGLLNAIQTALSSVTDTGWKAASLGTHTEQLSESLKLVGQAGLMLDKELDDYGKKTYTQGIQTVKERLTDIKTIVDLATEMGTVGEGEEAKQFDLTAFSEGIANIGAAIQLYNRAMNEFKVETPEGTEGLDASEIEEVNTSAISRAITSVMAVLKDVKFDDGEVGEIEKWAGLKEGSTAGSGTLFALGLTNIANAMGTFSTAAKDFDNDNVKNSIKSLETLTEVKNKVENPKNYDGTITGITAWGDAGDPEHKGSFANAISSMGTAMAAFGQSVKDIPQDAVTNATTALDTLAKIYEKLNGHEDMLRYFSVSALGTTLTIGEQKDNKTVEQVFEDFALGIGKLGDALAAFSGSLTDESIGYDPTKVSGALAVLTDMSDIQKKLQEVDVKGDLFTKVIFGENDIKKLGDNMAGLGSRLTTFSTELKGFEVDVEGTEWKNIKGVLQFMADIWEQIGSLAYNSTEYGDNGNVLKTTMNSAYNLTDLASGLETMSDALVKFNESMRKVYKAVDGTETYNLGEWSASNFENIKAVITFLKDITIALGNAGVQEGAFYDLTHFGYDIQQLFNSIDDSQLGDFMTKLESLSSVTDTLKAFSGEDTEKFNANGIAMAVELLNGFSSRLNSADVEGGVTLTSIFTTMLGEIGKHEADFLGKGKSAGNNFIAGFGHKEDGKHTLMNTLFAELLTSINEYESQFFNKGKTLSNKFVEGFKNEEGIEFINRHSVFESSITTLITNILSKMDGYSTTFYSKGKSAGEQYALGFGAGFKEQDTTGILSTVVKMDSEGNTSSPTTGLAAILQTMNYATTSDITTVATHLDNIKTKFDTPINVNDSHGDVVTAINSTNEKLATISTDLGTLSSEVNNLKVYINSKILVGAIASDMDAELGRRSNLVNVSTSP